MKTIWRRMAQWMMPRDHKCVFSSEVAISRYGPFSGLACKCGRVQFFSGIAE
jgi:hypothetical protein